MHDQHRVLRWENRGRQLALLFMWNRCQFSELEVLGQSTHWRWKRASQNGYGEDVLLQVEISGEDGSVDLRVYVYAALSVVQIFTRNSIIQFSFSFEWDSLIQKRSMYLLQFSDPPAHVPIIAADSYKVASLPDAHCVNTHIIPLLFMSDSSTPQHMFFRSFCDRHFLRSSSPGDVPQHAPSWREH